ncbi:hypothetical protein FB467_0043 [Ornithinicoccus hortensis]|uniref:Uncharacterized protein n=1 Tax=Ornithinicoccus hortensis TaxID=82346 RepID=A0A542YLK8_9MICO|nr:hypothetical protein FB467_0043 [Ornithinicoccus hortensis]
MARSTVLIKPTPTKRIRIRVVADRSSVAVSGIDTVIALMRAISGTSVCSWSRSNAWGSSAKTRSDHSSASGSLLAVTVTSIIGPAVEASGYTSYSTSALSPSSRVRVASAIMFRDNTSVTGTVPLMYRKGFPASGIDPGPGSRTMLARASNEGGVSLAPRTPMLTLTSTPSTTSQRRRARLANVSLNDNFSSSQRTLARTRVRCFPTIQIAMHDRGDMANRPTIEEACTRGHRSPEHGAHPTLVYRRTRPRSDRHGACPHEHPPPRYLHTSAGHLWSARLTPRHGALASGGCLTPAFRRCSRQSSFRHRYPSLRVHRITISRCRRQSRFFRSTFEHWQSMESKFHRAHFTHRNH